MISPAAGFDIKPALPTPKSAGTGSSAKSPAKSSPLELSTPASKQNDAPVVNATSATQQQNSNGFSGPADFKNVLRNKVDTQIEKPDSGRPENDVKDAPETEDQETLAGSEGMEEAAPAMARPPLIKNQATIAPNLTGALDHRMAWNSFMHKMKEKFGVSARHILAAFKSLTEEELKQPPEQNITKLVTQLGLSDQQAALAHQYFRELIQRTDTKSLGEEPAPLAVASAHEASQARTEQSLQQVNQKFFMKTQGTPPKGTPPQAEHAPKAQPLPLKTVSDPEAREDREGAFELPPEFAPVPAAATEQMMPVETIAPEAPQAPAPAAAHATKAVTEKTATHAAKAPLWQQDTTQFESPVKTAAPAAPFAQKAMVPPPILQTSLPSIGQTGAAPAAPVPPPMLMPKPVFAGTPDTNRDDGDDQHAATDGDDSASAVAAPFSPNGTQKAEAGETKLVATQPQAMPVHDLVQQAHVLVKDGGGEMRVVLKPDGLGEVVMKVTVNGDKVNVQAITQSDEAKRVLESGFKTLKDGLNLHHLNLDGLKVDTLAGLSKQMDQQFQDAQKQSARQFLEQFHQNLDQRRQSMFDIPGADVYRSQTKSRPDMSAAREQAQRAQASRRLDLVA